MFCIITGNSSIGFSNGRAQGQDKDCERSRASELKFILIAREPVLQRLRFFASVISEEQTNPSDVDPLAEYTETTLLTLIQGVQQE
jgi:predicted nucleotidyltransferase